MARTVESIRCTKPRNVIDQRLRQILIQEDYREIQYNLEVVWKKGTGLMTAMHYIKLEYLEDTLVISGWIQMGVGSVGGKEHDLNGMMAKIPKSSVRKTMDKLKAAVWE